MRNHATTRTPPPVAGAPPAWMDRARCAETDPELFFPEKGGSPAVALAICGTCEVAAECLAYALQFPVLPGVWGGTTEKERRVLRRQRRRAAA